MNDQPAPVDFNTAGLEELRTLPGVGPALAERILAARPFASLDDLRRVSGISPALLDRWGDRVALSPLEPAGAEAGESSEMAQDASPPDQTEIPAMEAGPVEPAPEQLEQPEGASPAPGEPELHEAVPGEEPHVPAEVPPKPQPRFTTRPEAYGLAIGALLIATVLAAVLSLSLLSLVNGGLRYARPYQIDELSRQVEGLNSEANLLQQDMDALRARIDNLEGLSGRLGAAEKAIAAVNQEMDTAQAQADSLGQQVDQLDQALGEMQARTDRFQGFLQGLQQLMQGIFK